MSTHPYLVFSDVDGGLRVGTGSSGLGLTNENVTIVIIPSSFLFKDIVEIGHTAFYYTKIVSVYIPNTVTYLNNGAFYGCSHLVEVVFEPVSQITMFDRNVFKGCSSLLMIDIPASLHTMISTYSISGIFQNANNLQCISYLGSSDFSSSFLFTNNPVVHVADSLYPHTSFGSIQPIRDGMLCSPSPTFSRDKKSTGILYSTVFQILSSTLFIFHAFIIGSY